MASYNAGRSLLFHSTGINIHTEWPDINANFNINVNVSVNVNVNLNADESMNQVHF
jgi:hypothetical protein